MTRQSRTEQTDGQIDTEIDTDNQVVIDRDDDASTSRRSA